VRLLWQSRNAAVGRYRSPGLPRSLFCINFAAATSFLIVLALDACVRESARDG
jgi:hypothetical protein